MGDPPCEARRTTVARFRLGLQGTARATASGRERIGLAGSSLRPAVASDTDARADCGAAGAPPRPGRLPSSPAMAVLRLAALAPFLLVPALYAQQPAASSRPPATLDTVRVASRTGASLATSLRSVEVVGREAIDRSSARTVGELLATRLGVDLLDRSPAQADLQLRGASPDQVLLLVDGVRASDVQSGHYALDLALPLDAVERVEILRGTGSTLYGSDAIGGVINIVTRRAAGAPPSVNARLAGGSFGRASAGASATGALGPLAARAAGSFDRADGGRPGTDYRVSQGTLALERGPLALDAGVGARDFGAADFYGPYPSYERTRSATAALRYAALRLGAWTLDATLHARRHTDDYILLRDDPSYYRNHHLTWQDGAVLTARAGARGATALVLGAEGFDATLASDRLGHRREQRAALFGEGTLGSSAGARLDAGARVDWSDQYRAFFSPSLAGAIAIAPAVQLRASVDRGFRAPTWQERYYTDPSNVGDPSLRPETFWAGEAGVRALPRWGRLDVAAFVRTADGLIDWARPVGADATTPWRTMNVAHATYRGVEAEALLPPLGGTVWTLRASALRFHAEGAEGYQGKYALHPLTRTLGADVDAPLPWGALLSVQATTARRAGARAFTRADARLARPWRDLRLTLDVRNVTDADYLDASAKRVEGRSVAAGVEWRGILGGR